MAITTDGMIATTFATRLRSGLSAYLDYPSKSITGPSPVSGSNVHDGVDDDLHKGMNAWQEAITRDSDLIESSHDALTSIDSKLKAQFMSLGV